MTTAEDRPGNLPFPTPELARREPLLRQTMGPLYRIYREIHRSPIFFGNTLTNRFDSAARECGVLYASTSLKGAFAETFMQELGACSVSRRELRTRPVATIFANKWLRLVDLCAEGGQARLGLDGRICTGSHIVAQAWSDALRKHPSRPDGILFPSRHELTQESCALFETAKDALLWEPWGTLDDPAKTNDLLTLLRMGNLGLTE